VIMTLLVRECRVESVGKDTINDVHMRMYVLGVSGIGGGEGQCISGRERKHCTAPLL
jgi:hypothetical protein